MAYVDNDGAVETYDPPIRVFMSMYGPSDRVAQTLGRLLAKVRRGGPGTFCASILKDTRVRVELLENNRVQVDISDKDGKSSYVIEPGDTPDHVYHDTNDLRQEDR